jgi:predicted aconitase with swiveling domain
MSKTFKGRVIAGGDWKGVCAVSKGGFNTLASFKKSVLDGDDKVLVSDQNNADLFGKNITGTALCLPQTIGSTTGGLILQTVCSMGLNPKAMLFSEHIDSLAASGIVLAKVWENSDIIAIDQLGPDFLAYAETGKAVEIKSDGTVILE